LNECNVQQPITLDDLHVYVPWYIIIVDTKYC